MNHSFILKRYALSVFVSLTLLSIFIILHTGSPSEDLNPRVKPPSVITYKPSNINQLPIYFEKNMGQVDESVDYYVRNSRYSIELNRTGFITHLNNGDSSATNNIRAILLNANRDSQLSGSNQLDGTINYLLGNDKTQWHTNVPTYAQVDVTEVYPGIDLRYHSLGHQLEYDFIVTPESDVKNIRIAFDGADLLSINAAGDLIISTGNGELKHQKPVFYQDIDGQRQFVEGKYVLNDEHSIGFQIAAYNKAHSLIIDPVVDYATYFGGELEDNPRRP